MHSTALYSSRTDISTYMEEFKPVGHRKPVKARPSSATRRNNPHPRPDFLLPRRLQNSQTIIPNRVRQLVQNYLQVLRPTDLSLLPMKYNTSLLPPVKYNSLTQKESRSASIMKSHTPGCVKELFPQKPLLSSERGCGNSSNVWLCKLQELQTLVKKKQPNASLHNLERKIPVAEPMKITHNYCENTHNSSSNRLPQTHLYPNKFLRETTQDFRCDYSCFRVVKQSQPGHYVIHPEFVSESENLS